MSRYYRVKVQVVAVDESGRMDRGTTVEQWVVFPPNSTIPGYPATNDATDHSWVAYEDDGSGNGDAVNNGEARSLSHTFSVLAEAIVKRYF